MKLLSMFVPPVFTVLGTLDLSGNLFGALAFGIAVFWMMIFLDQRAE